MTISKAGNDGVATALTLASAGHKLARVQQEKPLKPQIQADLLKTEARLSKLQVKVASLELEAEQLGAAEAKGQLSSGTKGRLITLRSSRNPGGEGRLIAVRYSLNDSRAALGELQEKAKTLRLLSQAPESELAGQIYRNNRRIVQLKGDLRRITARTAHLKELEAGHRLNAKEMYLKRTLHVREIAGRTELSNLSSRQEGLIERLKSEPHPPKLSRADRLGGSVSLLAAGFHGYAAATRLASGDRTSGWIQAAAATGNAVFAASALTGRAATMGKAGLILGTGAAVTGLIVDGLSS